MHYIIINSSHSDRSNLISQNNSPDKLYDHDTFLEPALAKSLHLREILSVPKLTHEIKVQYVCRQQSLDPLQSKKINIPSAAKSFLSANDRCIPVTNSKCPNSQEDQSTIELTAIPRRKLSLSLKKKPNSSSEVVTRKINSESSTLVSGKYTCHDGTVSSVPIYTEKHSSVLSHSQENNHLQHSPDFPTRMSQGKQEPILSYPSTTHSLSIKQYQDPHANSLSPCIHKQQLNVPLTLCSDAEEKTEQKHDQSQTNCSSPQTSIKRISPKQHQLLQSKTHESTIQSNFNTNYTHLTDNNCTALKGKCTVANADDQDGQSTDESIHSIQGAPCSPVAPPYSPIGCNDEQVVIAFPILQQAVSHCQLPPPISNLLPTNYTYIFKFFRQLDGQEVAFDTKFYVNVNTEIGAKKWMREFEEKTSTTYQITKGTKTLGKKVLYKTVRHCMHKRKKSNKPSKNNRSEITRRDKKTDCSSTLLLRVHNKSKSNSRVSWSTHPCEVNLLWQHNHSIHSAHALSFKPISEDTKRIFYDYFDQGYSPSTARQHHTIMLSIQCEGDEKDLEQVHADRSINPLSKDIDYLFVKWRQERHGSTNGESMFEKLEEKVRVYNEENRQEGGQALVQRYVSTHEKETTWFSEGGQPLVLAICTPIMARAHQMLRQAGELVYVDATSSLDRYNCPTFMFSTCTPAGGLPLGVVITSGEDEASITEAFSFLKSILPQNAFYGRGANGPEMCITDDCTAERSAIHNTWSETKLFLCIFHYLQSWWTWLWDGKQGITKDDRPVLIGMIKRMVFSKSQEELEERYQSFIKCDHPDSYAKKYPKLFKHLETFWERRSEWALSFRMEMIFRNNHTNNYAEAAIRVLKEMVFGRMKAYNLIQMFNFITDTMELYYKNRLLDMAHSRYRPDISLRFSSIYKLSNTIVHTEQFSESIYSVSEECKGEIMDFLVDMEVGTCSCIRGVTGSECEHQAAIAKEYNIYAVNIPSFFSKTARKTFATLAVGTKKEMHLDFYADLKDASTSPTNDPDHVIGEDESECLSSSTVEDNHQTSGIETKMFTDSNSEEQSELNKCIEAYKEKLFDIANDILMRVQTGDGNLISGLNRFIRQYGKIKSAICPTPVIAHALHTFGKEDSKSATS